MGQDNQPKKRQALQLARKEGRRASYDRILIVSEGSKTEPHYFGEIRSYYKLHTANVQVQPSARGTQPLQVVEFAEQLFLKGDTSQGIRPRAFEQVYAVFDRDDHATYHAALAKAVALGDKLRNDLGTHIKFEAIASVPCFEMWLLLHFEDVLAPMHRFEVYRRLQAYLPAYDKGQLGQFAATRTFLEVASLRAKHLAEKFDAHDAAHPYTGIHRLVNLLVALKAR